MSQILIFDLTLTYMKRLTGFFFMLFVSIWVNAQKVQWAAEVGEVSSEAGDKQYGAIQALGEPSAYPASDYNATAWSPKKSSSAKGEFIRVKFDNPEIIQQVVIVENHNPGAISSVTIFSTGGGEHEIYHKPAKPLDKATRVLNIILPAPTPYKVRQVKVEMDTKTVEGFNCIDAIGVAESTTPITVSIPLAEDADFPEKAENLGTSINSSSHDYIPQISPDGNTLYFTRVGHPENMGKDKFHDIWYSKKVGNKWDAAVKMSAPINNELPNFAYNITPDGNTLLLGNSYGEDADGFVATSRREKNGWSFPERAVVKDLHSLSLNNEFFLAANKKVMLMSIDRPEGQGSNDIYVSFLEVDNTWTTPKNIGKVVNTANIETSPFLAADNKTMYFSSNGHRGYGDKDIFKTTRLDDTWEVWSTPVNLGNTINSEASENYYSIPASGEYAYFVSQHNSLGGNDIFRVKLPNSIKPQPVALIYGNVYNADTKKPMSADILYEIMPQGLSAGFASSDPETGEYKIVLPLGEEYSFFAEKYGFLSVTDNINLKDIKDEYVEINRDLYLAPLKRGQKIVMNSVLFYQSESTMIPSSTSELKRMAKVMNDRPSMVVKLHGHTDNHGNYDANMKLSQDRVDVVKTYLVEHGIDESRIQSEGHGPKDPVVENDTMEHRRRNRRVEFEIVTF